MFLPLWSSLYFVNGKLTFILGVMGELGRDFSVTFN